MNKQITVFSAAVLHNNKILMVLRTEEELPEAHMKWEFPGGKCNFGETPQETIIRELREETGIDVSVNTLLPFIQTSYWNYSWGTQQTLCFVFACSFIKAHKQKKMDHHIAKIGWFTIEEARELNSLPGTKEILDLVDTENL
jgi:8-oxo-dGTP diphosphatase